MNTLITIPEEIAGWIGIYMRDQRDTLSKDQLELLESYRTNENVLHMMGFSFFIEWENAGFIRPTVRQWTEQGISYLLEAEK